MAFGFGGSKDRSARRLLQLEVARQKRIDDSLAKINEIWTQNAPLRERLYDQARSASYNLHKSNLDRLYSDRQRDARNNIARRGLLGSSAQVFTNRRLSDDYREGISRATQQADAAAAQFRQQDEATRANLSQAALSGLDAANINAQALTGLSNNLQAARPQLAQDLFTNLFRYAGPSAVNQYARQEGDRIYTALLGS